MADGIYNRAKYNWMAKVVDMVNDTIKVMLLTSVHTFDADHDVIGDVSANEISGTGYSAGGATLGSKTLTQDDTNDRAVFDGADTQWTTATFTARHAVLWDDTPASDPLLCNIDFGTDKSVTGGTFTISWNASGIIRIS